MSLIAVQSRSLLVRDFKERERFQTLVWFSLIDHRFQYDKNTFCFIVVIELCHSALKAHIYRQENSAQQASTVI